MNLEFDFSIVTRFFRGIVTELRQKRLWPVAAVLLAALVAVPILLSKSSSTPVAQTPAAVPPPSTGTSLPAISVQSTPVHTTLRGSSRNPFGAASGAISTPTGSTSSAASGAVTAGASATQGAANTLSAGSISNSGSSATGTSSTATSSTGTSSTSSGAGTSNPPSITGNTTPKPVHTGLSSKQAYDVALSITNSVVGVDAIDPLTRLSVLPSDDQQRLVELGVLKGGSRVVFALQPGTKVSGPGSCIPGPIDCELLELGQDQTESISTQTPTGWSEVALFAITGITVNDYSTAAAANKARDRESAAGQALLSQSSLPTLTLFQYEPSVGSVVDLRNLTVGG